MVDSHIEPNMENEPANELERGLIEVTSGNMSKEEFLRLFLTSKLFILIDGEPVGNTLGERKPLVFALSADSEHLLAVFSTPLRARNMTRFFAEYSHTVQVNMEWVLGCLGASTGIALNPGSELGFEMSAAGAHELRQALQG